MGWKVWGDWFATADFGLSGGRYVKATLGEDSLFVVAIRTWLIIYNNPTYTSLTAKIYSNNNGVPGTLLFTSASVLKADVTTDANGVREIAFPFNAPLGVQLRAGDTYFIVLDAVGYTGTASAHLAWKKSYPETLYPGWTPTSNNVSVAPYAFHLVAAVA